MQLGNHVIAIRRKSLAALNVTLLMFRAGKASHDADDIIAHANTGAWSDPWEVLQDRGQLPS